MSKSARLSRRAGELFLHLLEQRRPIIAAAALDDLLPGARPSLAAVGALVLHGTARSVLTAGDDGPTFREVVALAEGNDVGYFDAADGSVAVAPDEQKLLRVSLPWWVAWLASSLKLANCSQPTEIVPDHSWDIGDLWIDRHRKVPVIFARRLHREENRQALTEALQRRAGRGDPLILTSSRVSARSGNDRVPAPISLVGVLTNDANSFVVDLDLILSPYRGTGTAGFAGPLRLSPDGRLLVIRGIEIRLKSAIHIAIVQQIVAAQPAGALAREILEKAGSAAPTLQKAFGKKKWALLKDHLKSTDGLWSFVT